MALVGSTQDETDEPDYYDQVIGAVIVAVHDDNEGVWLHLSDGSVIQFYALCGGGFNGMVHPADERR